jgi:hypothetical protein
VADEAQASILNLYYNSWVSFNETAVVPPQNVTEEKYDILALAFFTNSYGGACPLTKYRLASIQDQYD